MAPCHAFSQLSFCRTGPSSLCGLDEDAPHPARAHQMAATGANDRPIDMMENPQGESAVRKLIFGSLGCHEAGKII